MLYVTALHAMFVLCALFVALPCFCVCDPWSATALCVRVEDHEKRDSVDPALTSPVALNVSNMQKG